MPATSPIIPQAQLTHDNMIVESPVAMKSKITPAPNGTNAQKIIEFDDRKLQVMNDKRNHHDPTHTAELNSKMTPEKKNGNQDLPADPNSTFF